MYLEVFSIPLNPAKHQQGSNKSMIIDNSILYFSPSGNSNIQHLYLKKTKNIPLAKNTKSSNLIMLVIVIKIQYKQEKSPIPVGTS